jgi:hypothetical protein
MKRKTGRKPHRPTAATRKLVSALCVNGVAQARIAEAIDVCERTLRTRYRREISLATEALCAKACTNLSRLMAGPGTAAVLACKFVLSVKAGWKESAAIAVAVDMAGAESPVSIIAAKLAQLAARRAEIETSEAAAEAKGASTVYSRH